MKNFFILILFFASQISAVYRIYDTTYISKSLKIDSAFHVGKKPLSTNPKYSAVFDSASNLLKTWPLDSITAHSTYSDSSGVSGIADTALNTPDSVGYADSATHVPPTNISDSLDIIRDTLNNRLPLHGKADSSEASDSAGKAYHGVTAGYTPYSLTTSTWGTSNIYYDGTNNGINTTSPKGKFDISSSGKTLFLGADPSGATTRTDDNAKEARVATIQYDNDEEGSAALVMFNDDVDNQLLIGGGSNLLNTATAIGFYTAANNTTTTGTKRLDIASTGAITSYYEHKFNYATAGRAAYFDADKGLQASSTVSTEELLFVDKTLVAQQSLTDGSATTMFEIAVASGSVVGGKFSYTIGASSGTSRQALSGECVFNGVNEAGTIHSDIEKVGLEALTAPGSSLTSAFTITDGAGKITINCNANSDIATPVIVIDYKLEMHTAGAITEL